MVLETGDTLTPTNLPQTVPQAAHTMRHRLKIGVVTSVELKCEVVLNVRNIIIH